MTGLYKQATAPVPNSVSNLSAIFSVPAYFDISSIKKPKRSVEDDPVKKRIKDNREKKMSESKDKISEADKKEVKKEIKPEVAGPADLKVDEVKTSDAKSEKVQPADIREVKAP